MSEKAQSAKLAELAQGMAEELWHDPEGKGWATVKVRDEHAEHWPLNSNGFRRWLRGKYLNEYGTVPGRQAEQDAANTLDAIAYYNGDEHPVHVRIAGHEGRIYLDLADKDWSVVEVGPQGWRVLDSSPVRFRRTPGMLPLPMPAPDGDLKALRRFVNVKAETDWHLFLACAVASLRPRGPYPVLQLRGEQGSAKSTVARVHRALIDPNVSPLRAEPSEGRDLMIAARNGWEIALDNLTKLPDWLSDALCRLSTGGGFATRELYSDDSEVLFDAQRPVILTGIDDFVTRGDLQDRTVTIDLEPIPERARRTETALWEEFGTLHADLLGALLDALAGVLREEPHVYLDHLPRMADFAVMGVALERALGWSKGAFMGAYLGNRSAVREQALEDWPIAPLLRDMEKPFEGTATELLSALAGKAGLEATNDEKWPKRPKRLSEQLGRIAPDLRAAGWADVQRGKSNGRRAIHVSPVRADEPGTQAGTHRDAQGRRQGRTGTHESAESEFKGTHRDAQDALSPPLFLPVGTNGDAPHADSLLGHKEEGSQQEQLGISASSASLAALPAGQHPVAGRAGCPACGGPLIPVSPTRPRWCPACASDMPEEATA